MEPPQITSYKWIKVMQLNHQVLHTNASTTAFTVEVATTSAFSTLYVVPWKLKPICQVTVYFFKGVIVCVVLLWKQKYFHYAAQFHQIRGIHAPKSHIIRMSHKRRVGIISWSIVKAVGSRIHIKRRIHRIFTAHEKHRLW